MKKSSLVILLIIALWAPLKGWSFEVPALHDPIEDQVGLLSMNEKLDLNSKLDSFYKKGFGQIAVLIVSDLQGDSIENAAIQTFDSWKLGTEKKDDGVLLLIAINDRRVRIEVGQGFEGDLTDLESKRIIDYIIAPAFKQKRFYEGLLGAVSRIMSVVSQGKFAVEGTDAGNIDSKNWNYNNHQKNAPSKLQNLLDQFGIMGILIILFLGIWGFIYLGLNFIIFILNSFIFIGRPIGLQKKYIQYISFGISVLIMMKIFRVLLEIAVIAGRSGGRGGGYSGGGYSGGGGRSSGGGASGGW